MKRLTMQAEVELHDQDDFAVLTFTTRQGLFGNRNVTSVAVLDPQALKDLRRAFRDGRAQP